MDIKNLKAQLFDIRRELDILQEKEKQLIALYNQKLKELVEIEKNQNKNQSQNKGKIE